MKLLIVGAQGFIGQNAYGYFSKKADYQVFRADILPIQAADYLPIAAENPDWGALFQAQQWDICLNCAGAANVSASFQNPSLDFELNVKNVAAILENLRVYQPQCRFINLSSAAVYGNPNQMPVSELADIQPLSPYGFDKKMSEILCLQYAQCFGLRTCSLRIFSAYGEGLRKQLFWDIYQKTLANPQQIELFGTGDESRDFIYIQDLCSVLETVMGQADFKGEAINVANGQEIFIKDAVAKFLQLLDYKGNVIFNQQQRVGDPLRWQAQIQTIQRFNYQPQFSLAQGLANYVQWLKKSN